MRIPHWPALVCGLMLAATLGRTAVAAPPRSAAPGKVTLASASDDSDSDEPEAQPFAGGGGTLQPVPAPGYAPSGPPAFVAQAPYQGGAPGGYSDMSGVVPPSAWPQDPTMAAPRIAETYNQGGLWQYHEDDEYDFKTVFSLDYLYGSGKRPGPQYIGSSTQRGTTFFPGGNPGTFQANQTTGFIPNVHLDGLKAALGREKPDGSGMNLSGFILFEQSIRNAPQGYTANPDDPNTLRALWGIIVTDQNNVPYVLPFDTQFYVQYTQGIYGADADFWLTPFFERNTFKIKFDFGAKYLRIYENLFVRGDDSGLGYTAGTAGGGNGTGDPSTITGPFTTLTTATNYPLAPYSTYISSSTVNNLVGPAIGIRYEVGGEHFKIAGMTKVAIAANVQQSNITSNNLNLNKAPGTGNLVVAGNDFLNQTQVGATTQTLTNTHISPIFDTSLWGEFNGFAWIPLINRMDVFKHAKTRIGWNYVYVNEVARAAADINYNLHGATINTSQRSSFGFNTVNFAVDWRF
ncbi:MAG: BBP7 family outer membrane beta-barrel protein [Planctomycetes bacterium]|nr:BBP7 family outer membrane beta-barrel protein [Planctomycetota bacterium]